MNFEDFLKFFFAASEGREMPVWRRNDCSCDFVRVDATMPRRPERNPVHLGTEAEGMSRTLRAVLIGGILSSSW